MSARHHRASLLAIVCLVSSLAAAPAARASDETGVSQDPTRTAVEENAPSAQRATGNTSDATSKSSTRARSSSGSDMTLDAITIEGEIDVPQVLFITARDHFRDTDFLHHLYLADLAVLGRGASRRGGLGWESDRDDSNERKPMTIPKSTKE